MIQNRDQLATILSRSSFSGRDLKSVPVLDTGEVAFVADLEVDQLEAQWRVARQLLPQTGLWPVVFTNWGEESPEGIAEMLFSRYNFKESLFQSGDVSPQGLIARSRKVDVPAFVDYLHEYYNEREREYFDDSIEWELEQTETAFGKAPRRDEIDFSLVDSRFMLDKLLLDWELKNYPSGNTPKLHVPWFEPENASLVFLPADTSWKALAYIGWYGIGLHGAHNVIALARGWQEHCGVELVCHYGTMLQYFVLKPPDTIDKAWQLALQHFLLASSIASSDTLRDYARSLLGHDRWFLHERP